MTRGQEEIKQIRYGQLKIEQQEERHGSSCHCEGSREIGGGLSLGCVAYFHVGRVGIVGNTRKGARCDALSRLPAERACTQPHDETYRTHRVDIQRL